MCRRARVATPAAFRSSARDNNLVLLVRRTAGRARGWSRGAAFLPARAAAGPMSGRGVHIARVSARRVASDCRCKFAAVWVSRWWVWAAVTFLLGGWLVGGLVLDPVAVLAVEVGEGGGSRSLRLSRIGSPVSRWCIASCWPERMRGCFSFSMSRSRSPIWRRRARSCSGGGRSLAMPHPAPRSWVRLVDPCWCHAGEGDDGLRGGSGHSGWSVSTPGWTASARPPVAAECGCAAGFRRSGS